jgi:hypothetical protein
MWAMVMFGAAPFLASIRPLENPTIQAPSADGQDNFRGPVLGRTVNIY